MSVKKFHIILLLTLFSNAIFAAPAKKTTPAQNCKKKVFITADVFEGYSSDDENESLQQFVGNVKAVTKDFTYRADIATFFDKKHLIESEGHIRVTGNKKKFNATMGKVLYDTKEKIAYMKHGIKGQQDNLFFFTDELEYHSQRKELIFQNSAKFKDDEMTTTSVQGVINTKTKFVTLTEDVFVDMKEHELECQKLTYNTKNEIIKFDQDVKLTIKKDKSFMTTPCEGVYKKKEKKIFLKEGLFHSKSALGFAREIMIDQEADVIQADDDIELINKNNDFFTSQHLTYNIHDNSGVFYGDPLIQKNNGREDLYLIADRFEFLQDSLPESEHDFNVFDDEQDEKDEAEKKEEDDEDKKGEGDVSKEENNKKPFLVKGLGNVNVYSENFQGKSKNLYFDARSSRIVFDGDPIFWTNDSQLSGQDVEMRIKKNDIERLDIFKNAFMIIKDEIGFYNQSKGKSMHIRFFENKLDDLILKDNVESLLFITNDGKFVGTNNVKCPKMTIDSDEDFKPEKIIFLDQSSAVFYPKDQVDVSALTLPGFKWRIKERPKLEMFLKRIPEVSNIPENEQFVEEDSKSFDNDDL